MHNTISSPCNAIENVILPKCHYNTPTGNIYQGKSWSNMHPPSYRRQRESVRPHITRLRENTDRLNVQDTLSAQVNQALLSWEKVREMWDSWEPLSVFYCTFYSCCAKEPAASTSNIFESQLLRLEMFKWKTIKEGFQNCIAKIHETLIPNFAVHRHPREASSNNICFIYCSDQTKRACIFYKHYY